MTLLALLFRKSRGLITMAVLLGMAAGISGAAMISVINQTLAAGSFAAAYEKLPLFAGLAVTVLVTRLLSQVQLNVLQQQVVEDLRMDLCERMLVAPLRKLEESGSHRLLAALTEDIYAISTSITLVPYILVNVATIIACLGYLAFLSLPVLAVLLAVIALVSVTYVLPMRSALQQIYQRREQHDQLFAGFRSLVEGTKELQLHGARRRAFMDEQLKPTAQAVSRMLTKANNLFIISGNWGNFMMVAVIGAVLFGIPHFFDVPLASVAGYTLVVLYLQQPLDALVTQIPHVARSQVSLQKLEELGLSLAKAAEPQAAGVTFPASFERIELAGITHSYYREHEDGHFTLGPINATLRRGQIVFLVGGNGSGKTTLAKLFTGLYAPEAGEIRVDGVPVQPAARAAYRELFTAVFFDFHIFDRMLGIRPEQKERAEAYLARLQLDRKVKIVDGKLSTTALSQGQRKRLALLTAYLEDRPVYVFDEWAADQDPVFRELFYRELLPELRALGKLVFVISHDDRYFHLGDRILKLEAGQLLPESQQPPVTVGNVAASA